MGLYSKFLNNELFLIALKNNNRVFMQNALLAGAFDKSIFKEEKLIQNVLLRLNYGSNLNFILNVILLTEISYWKNKYLKELLKIFRDLV